MPLTMRWAFVALLIAAVPTAAQQPPAAVDVYKTPTCGCCSKWVAHMRANGFTVKTTDVESTGPIQGRHAVPTEVRSCHTALVGGYVLEGHVPAAEVKRLLKERPRIAGIAVPGMPAGSPGMEMDGVDAQPYHVVSFDRTGRVNVFATYPR
jgi:hypothetical protein